MHTRTRTLTPTLLNRRLSFYAAVFNEPSKVYDPAISAKPYTEVVMPGAFTWTLNTQKEVYATVEHKEANVFSYRSKGLILQQDDKGLFCSCWLPDNDIGNGVQKDVEAGRFGGASIGFAKYQRSANPDAVELTEVDLFDVSLVEAPAYPTDAPHLRSDQNLKRLLRWYKIIRAKSKYVHEQSRT